MGSSQSTPYVSGATQACTTEAVTQSVSLSVSVQQLAPQLWVWYRGKYISTPHGAAHLMVGALRAQQVLTVLVVQHRAGSAVGSYAQAANVLHDGLVLKQPVPQLESAGSGARAKALRTAHKSSVMNLLRARWWRSR